MIDGQAVIVPKSPHLRLLSIFPINVQRELRTTASEDPTGQPRRAG